VNSKPLSRIIDAAVSGVGQQENVADGVIDELRGYGAPGFRSDG
jgi:hypothetical protein